MKIMVFVVDNLKKYGKLQMLNSNELDCKRVAILSKNNLLKNMLNEFKCKTEKTKLFFYSNACSIVNLIEGHHHLSLQQQQQQHQQQQ